MNVASRKMSQNEFNVKTNHKVPNKEYLKLNVRSVYEESVWLNLEIYGMGSLGVYGMRLYKFDKTR